MNEYIVDGKDTILRVTRRNGDVYDFIIDTEDLDMVKSFGGWTILERKNNPNYRYLKCKGQLLHRLVMGNPEGLVVDHIDRNTRNTRKNNLRAVTESINRANSDFKRNGKGNKGTAYFDNSRGKWRARVEEDGKRKWLGQYSTEQEARDVLAKYLGN